LQICICCQIDVTFSGIPARLSYCSSDLHSSK
jgi:hypothetical protein